MYCIKCGAKNSDEAIFCQKCGNQFELEGEEITQIVGVSTNDDSIDDDEERDVFSIRPTLLFVKIGYGLAVIGAFLLVALIASLGLFISSPVSAWIVVLIGLSLLFIPAYYHLKQKMIRYTLTDSKVEIDEGLISKTTRNVPLRIIQDVTVSANFYQRMLGFGDVEIENANENDNLIVLKNINSPKKHAAELLDQMRRLNK